MKLSVKQFSDKLNKKISDLQSDRVLRLAALTVSQERIKRIFEDGENSAGSKIGTYNSTTPIYVSLEQAPRSVNKKGKTGKPIKSGYYASYKAFRSAMGRESNFVNLRLVGELQNDLANAKVDKSITIPKSQPIKISETQYAVTLKKEINKDKKRGLEAKYGTIFNHTKEERDLFNKTVQREFNELLKK